MGLAYLDPSGASVAYYILVGKSELRLLTRARPARQNTGDAPVISFADGQAPAREEYT
jgi:hypothetical protein